MLSLGLYLQPVHVIYLLIADETGAIGLGIFIWFIVQTYRRLFAKLKQLQVKVPVLKKEKWKGKPACAF